MGSQFSESTSLFGVVCVVLSADSVGSIVLKVVASLWVAEIEVVSSLWVEVSAYLWVAELNVASSL